MVQPLDHIGHIEDDVGILERTLHEFHHRLLQAVVRLENARRIGIDDLEIVAVDDAQNPVARGLRLGGDDRKPFAHERVHERGFSHVGIADDVDETRFVHDSVRLAGKDRVYSRTNPCTPLFFSGGRTTAAKGRPAAGTPRTPKAEPAGADSASYALRAKHSSIGRCRHRVSGPVSVRVRHGPACAFRSTFRSVPASARCG